MKSQMKTLGIAILLIVSLMVVFLTQAHSNFWLFLKQNEKAIVQIIVFWLGVASFIVIQRLQLNPNHLLHRKSASIENQGTGIIASQHINQINKKTHQITIEESDFLQITNHSVIYKKAVYQIKNVIGFSIGEFKEEKISQAYITTGFVIAVLLMVYSFSILKISLILSTLPLLIWLTLVAYNKNKRFTRYGLVLHLNSGDKKVFISQDVHFLEQMIRVLINLIENPQENTSINISFSRSSITIETKSVVRSTDAR